MANDGPVFDVTGAREVPLIDQAVFVVFLLLIFVGVSPFAIPPAAVSVYGASAMTGSGDAARQVSYLLAFVAIVVCAYRSGGTKALLSVPLPIVLLLAWCLLSALWADQPGVTFRRAGLAAVVVFSAFLSVRTVGPERSLTLWRCVLLGVLVVNIASIHFIPQAVHQANEVEASLAGDWRGLYAHKNTAGAVGAITALIFLFSPRPPPAWSRKALDIGIAALAVFFTVMTRSKSSLGLLGVALIFGLIYRLAWRKDLDRTIVMAAGVFLGIVAVAFVVADQSAIARIFSDPEQFTGRTEIWKAEIAYIYDHPIFGSGFGNFADTGGLSPLRDYVGNGWVTEASHGHNGYLQMLVTIGVVGFLLAIAGLIAAPARAFWARGNEIETKALLFSLFVFIALHNLMESDFLEGGGVTWVTYLMMIAILNDLPRKQAPQ